MALLSPDADQDEALNKGQQNYDDRFASIAHAEENATSSRADGELDKPTSLDDEAGDWNSTFGEKKESATSKGRRFFSKNFLKKSSPLLGAGGIIALLGFVFTGLTAPSLLFVQMKETMVDRFNTQLATMEARSNKLLHSKVNNSTKGYCGAKITIRCKFSSLPERHLKKLKAAGITFANESKNALGRTTFTAYIIDGKEIPAQDFNREVASNAKLRSALRQAYNPKFGGFIGKGWQKIASRFKIKKQMPEFDAEKDPKGAQTKLNKVGKEGVSAINANSKLKAGESTPLGCDGDCNTLSDDNIKAIDDTSKSIEEAGKSGQAAQVARKTLSGVGLNSVTSAIKITGPMDSACMVYGTANTLSFAIKTIRNAQMIRFAMVFLSTADTIKAGQNPDPKNIEFLGKNLTNTIKDPDNPSKTLVGSATDSFGYKYAAYGDATASNKSLNISNRFKAGGGFSGDIDATLNTIYSFVPGGKSSLRGTCGVLGNPFVQAGSLIVGIASLFVPGANVGKIIVSGVAAAAVGVAMAILPDLIADTLAGSVTDDISGEESGNAIASGSGAMMSSLATSNGVGYMNKDQALAYNGTLTETKNDYIAMERSEKSPFDPTSPHTFVGSMVSNVIPIINSADSNPVTVIGSFLSSSLQGILPKASALTNEQYSKVLDSCSDLDLIDAGVATDPFCNTINGIPPQYLGKDPIKVIDELGSDISEDGKPQGEYKEFVSKCIESEDPFGYHDGGSGMSFDPDRAKECIINDSNANYYLNYVDSRIEENMDYESKSQQKTSSGEWVNPLLNTVPWGTYTSGRSHGKGAIDMQATTGTPVHAASSGTVIAAGEDSSYGNFVTIQHSDGSVTHYGHFDKTPLVKTGDTVATGQQIGVAGNTGDSDGAHLHFEGRTSPEWGSIVPTYTFMKERGVDLGPCSVTSYWEGPCSLSGYQ